MTIPPFPSQDLAKLVLGYLAEEQLMTAYDEFLQASPYLDAMQNEYDRIFMTSLRNILAEYRAVKIYVETCRPYLLRKKLFQCSNLLEIVKFLINYVDISKLESLDKFYIVEKRQSSNASKYVECLTCNSLKLTCCVCGNKQGHDASPGDDNTHSVETTSLADLPGNQAQRKRLGRSIEKSTNLSESVQNNSIHSTNVSMESLCVNKEQNLSTTSASLPKKDNHAVSSLNSTVKEVDLLMESKQKIEEFNSILNKVCQNNKDGNTTIQDKTSIKIVGDGSFQVFASGVTGPNLAESQSPALLSGLKTSNVQAAANRDPVSVKNAQEVDKRELFFKVEPKRKSQKRNSQVLPVLLPKPPKGQKIKILSNVKVNSSYQSNEKIQKNVLNNATSTPVQVQAIIINGKPAYRTHPISANLQNFTKEEILSMPTILAVPVPGLTAISSSASAVTKVSQIGIPVNKPEETDECLGPLVIDVPASPIKIKEGEKINNSELLSTSDLIKTVDVKNNLKNPSVPKDSHLSNLVDNNTPLVLPIARKSSSTPRRTSHIRVLDFGTPKPETIDEKIVHHNTNTHVEVFISRQSTTVGFDCIPTSVNSTNENHDNLEKVGIVKEKKTSSVVKKPKNKTSDWDADLRAMATISEAESMPKPREKNVKRKKIKTKKTDAEETDTVKPKPKKSRKKETENINLDKEVVIVQTDVPKIKPTINIKCGNDWNEHLKNEDKKENEKILNVNDEECIDTPEAERLTLQNVVGAKLNISELLETPYKQVLYDIQMETPRCLVPDLPGEPMSDLKIMNIPTPRFFDSPKIVHLTPSSYSSRPTDYSSGGSYYKPDDQDLQIRDLDFPTISPKQDETCKETPKENLDEGPKSTRPVRQCAKNVSYYKHSKIKESEDKSEGSSPNSESLQAKSTLHDKSEKSTKSERNSRGEVLSKSDSNKRNVKKRKSPLTKEKPRSFMKIKPRVRTPSKENLRRTRNSSSTVNNTPRSQRKIKERNTNAATITPSVPTKSRRKSSTPRKLHCSKSFNSEDVDQNSPKDVKETKTESCASNSTNTLDSDAEQLALRWSDDGSQDIKTKQDSAPINEIENLTKIQEYIKTTDEQSDTQVGTLQIDLIKRGFDAETAKIIERDLLDTPPRNDGNTTDKSDGLSISNEGKNIVVLEKTLKADSSSTDKTTDQSSEENECDVELTVTECNECSNNFFVCEYIESDKNINTSSIPFKDNFSMEICVDNDMTIRLRATPYTVLFDYESSEEQENYNTKETEDAVNSITNITKLYTPLKDSAKATCYEIFDSTLTSLDTPLKVNSPRKTEHEVTVSEIVIERDKADLKDKTETKKRKRPQSNSIDESVDSKKTKPDTQYLLSSANIQNIDIESVLQKLHGS